MGRQLHAVRGLTAFDRFDAGETIRGSLRRIVAGGEPGEFADRERIERAVLKSIA